MNDPLSDPVRITAFAAFRTDPTYARDVLTAARVVQWRREHWGNSQDPRRKRKPKTIVPATHCPHGHEWTPENTHIDRKGCRRCRACNNARRRKATQRRTLATATHCAHGHEWNEENTYITPQGLQVCRVCRRKSDAARVRKPQESTSSARVVGVDELLGALQ